MELDPDGRAGLQGRAMRELATVHRLSSTRLNRALKPLGLSMTHIGVLTQLLGPGGVSIGEIARRMEINQPGVSKVVASLAARGLVEVAAVDGDARRRAVQLTPAGMASVVQARAAMHPESTVTFTDLDDAQLDLLCALLATIRERLEVAPGGPGEAGPDAD